ncbi:MAG: DinB family protein [Phycisphaerales bacterium]|nr:DinB family protein [Phycisphaerales bacterium]
MDSLKIYDYLTKARERVFEAVRSAVAESPEVWRREFSIGLKTLGSTLTHMMIVEWSYVQRIQGRTMPPYEQWPIQDEHPPAFEVIEKTWRQQAPQTRARWRRWGIPAIRGIPGAGRGSGSLSTRHRRRRRVTGKPRK